MKASLWNKLKDRIGAFAKELPLDFDPSLLPDFADKDEEALLLLPGFCDVHVHFREPGFSYKETIKSGSLSAARGGYTDVCTMPNVFPVPDCLENLEKQLNLIRRDAVIGVHPFGAISVGEKGEALSDMESLSPHVCGFSDDGKGVQSEKLMLCAMQKAKALGKVLSAHCEDNTLLFGGYIHDGAYAKAHGHRGISSESEYRPIERDIRLCEKTGCAYHICHISTRESVTLIREAKKRGVNITCETAPHYLVLCDENLREDGRFKMNPPLRSRDDREALIEGLCDGTIDMIATDHAPHSAEEKAKGLSGSAFGIVGLETAFPILYTDLIQKGRVPFERVLDALILAPRKRFSLPCRNGFSIWDISKESEILPAEFSSLGKATPFEGRKVHAENLLTVYKGKIVYQNIEN